MNFDLIFIEVVANERGKHLHVLMEDVSDVFYGLLLRLDYVEVDADGEVSAQLRLLSMVRERLLPPLDDLLACST